MAPHKSAVLAAFAILSLAGCATGTDANNSTLGQRIVEMQHQAQVNRVWDGVELPAG